MERKFKVGDIVEVKSNNYHHFNSGDKVKIVGRFSNYAFHCERLSDNDRQIIKCEDMKENKIINKLIFRDNATILIKDGERYVAKCCEGDTYDREKGLLVCLAKASGYTFDDLQRMLEDAEDQGNKPNNAVKEVKRQAKVGEYIKIIKKSFSFSKVGDILKVNKTGFECVGILGKYHKRPTDNPYKMWTYTNDEYVVLENYKPSKKFTDASRKIILKALERVFGNGICFETEDEVREFYELIKGKFKIKNFNNNFGVGTKYFYCLDKYCNWVNGFAATYSYKELKREIKQLLKGENNGY